MTSGIQAKGNLVNVGSILQKARLSRNISVQEAANALHLRPSIVSAIEDNNYSEVPGHIFLKGYVRSYARYVGLPEEQVLTQLDHVLLDQELSRKPEAPEEGRKATRGAVFLGVALVGLIVLVLAGWLLGWQEWLILKTQEFTHTGSPVESAEIAVNEKSSVKPSGEPASAVISAYDESVKGALTPQLTNPLTEAPDRESSTVSVEGHTLESESVSSGNVSEGQVQNGLDESLSNGEQRPSMGEQSGSSVTPDDGEMLSHTEALPTLGSISEVSTSEESGVSPSEVTSVALEGQEINRMRGAPAAGAGLGYLEAEFSGDCWVQLKDGQGKTVISSLKRAGDSLRYSGMPPFMLVLGDATVVTVRFNERQVDLSSQKTWKKRAELILAVE